jgi:hypothetical protein
MAETERENVRLRETLSQIQAERDSMEVASPHPAAPARFVGVMPVWRGGWQAELTMRHDPGCAPIAGPPEEDQEVRGETVRGCVWVGSRRERRRTRCRHRAP